MIVKREIEDQLVIDALVTALEGGSNYWYTLDGGGVGIAKKYREEVMSQSEDFDRYYSPSEWVVMAVMNGRREIEIYDVEEEDELLGILSRESIQKGLDLMPSIHLNDLMDENHDAITADVLLQMSVMGEIVYG